MIQEGKKYRACLFDFDGTLANTVPLMYFCFQQTVKEFCKRDVSLEAIAADYHRLPTPIRKQLEFYVNGGTPFPSDAAFETVFSFYRKVQAENFEGYVTLFPGVMATLETLRQRGVRLGLVSARTHATLSQYVDFLHLRPLMEVIVGPESTAHTKPHPAPLLCALAQLGVTPGDALYVGDAPTDIECAHAAGAASCLVEWTCCPRDSFAASPPTHTLPQMADLLLWAPGPRAIECPAASRGA
ncbi:putative pyrophosphatase PpaX [Paratrimastix pyriformis]|uniref:Pyrophosphatase PpaX n=1 Tax=Paratrimastix pyriformis TaxID=342808 RepID=A0ABQ8ULS0_9EUKA|nr:putative pyrophosphatase PpaX [Paratrimastix pyriformis]